MRLQRVGNRKVGEKTYYKHIITLPDEVVVKLGWRPGVELSIETRGERVVLRSMGSEKRQRPSPSNDGTGYPEFAEKIRRELSRRKDGLTWSQIRDGLQLPQRVPNNAWVRRMERDIGLVRVKTAKGTMWRLERS